MLVLYSDEFLVHERKGTCGFRTGEIGIPGSGVDFGGYRPHYQGHGVTTAGGRGGTVYIVSNGIELYDAAVTASGPRFVIFDTSGNYSHFGGTIHVVNPFLTIAGQTSPNDGVTLVDTNLIIDTHDVVVQHIKIRRPQLSQNALGAGYAGDGGDNSHVYNVVFDHVTATWAKDVNNFLVAGPGSHDISILDCLFAEGLWTGAAGGTGAGIGYKNTVARSIFTNHWSRQPIWGSPAETALYNNISYNGTDISVGYGALAAFFGDADGDGVPGASESTVMVNNFVKAGPNSGSANAILGLSKKLESITAGSYIYLSGNNGPGITGPTGDGQWNATTALGSYGGYSNAATSGPSSNMRTDSLPGWWTAFGFVIIDTGSVLSSVLQSAGSRPTNRDAADNQMILDIQNGTGTHFLDTGDVTIPTLSVNTWTPNVPANPNDVVDGVGRTVIEYWLEGLAQAIE